MNDSYILGLLDKGLRSDGRKLEQYRDVKVEYGISSKSAEGSARVLIGDTEVVAGVKLDVGEPYPDQLDEGTLIVNAELSPIASPDFETGPPDIASIELARVTDRAIRECKAIDFKKLCIKKGEKVWLVFVDIYPINNDGNLFDAASLAALAALKDAKFPKYDEKSERILYEERTSKSLPLTRLPISCTLVKIKDKFIVDPNIEEESVMDARLTVGVVDDLICSLQKGGNYPINAEDIAKMIDIAFKKSDELRKAL